MEGARDGGAPVGLEVRLIATLMRATRPSATSSSCAASRRAASRTGSSPSTSPGPRRATRTRQFHREAIELARTLGLHVTVHAGEWGGAAQVLRSLSVNPERIAHGPHAIEDEACVAALIERGVVLDLCPTSNTQANIVESFEAFRSSG